MFDIINSEIQSIMNKALMKMLEKSVGSSASSISTLTSDINWDNNSTQFADLIKEAAARYGVDAGLVQAVVRAESNFNPDAVSSAGALGLMQLMPSTASSLGVTDPLDPEQNLDGGVKFLSQLLNRYNGNTSLALAAYNAGPGAVDKYGGVPPYSETQLYIQKILGNRGTLDSWEG
jgi:soluble lytic murein transglycosylase-like protein